MFSMSILFSLFTTIIFFMDFVSKWLTSSLTQLANIYRLLLFSTSSQRRLLLMDFQARPVIFYYSK